MGMHRHKGTVKGVCSTLTLPFPDFCNPGVLLMKGGEKTQTASKGGIARARSSAGCYRSVLYLYICEELINREAATRWHSGIHTIVLGC